MTEPLAPVFPYLQSGPWTVGPFTLHVFGIMISLGILVGYIVYLRRAQRLQLEPHHIHPILLWCFGTALVLSHFVYIVVYHAGEPVGGVLRTVDVFEGMSMFGGMLGGILGIALYTRRHRLSFLRYADTLLWGSVPMLFVARLGCAFAHDHPGTFTSSWFSVAWPASHLDQIYNPGGLPGRHDLGLYDVFLLAAILLVLHLTNARGQRFAGYNIVLCALLYAPVRFYLDTLRVSDTHYLGWTPGQYGALMLFLFGMALLASHLINPANQAHRPDSLAQAKRSHRS